MLRKSLLISLCLILFNINSEAQLYRTGAMGGLSYSIFDKDNSLTPFNFGNNPAWIYVDETETHLLISPSYSSISGDYRRLYDAEERIKYSAAFRGVKTLGTKGTFIGYTDYQYEVRKNYYRTLLFDTYSGEAFFMQDTTTGDFRFNGPKVNLMYSWELAPNLFAGISGLYKILDGLKNVYTNAQTMYREVGFNAGLAYQFSGNHIMGVNINYLDCQEKIEAKDVNLLEVEIFNFRGETFAIRRRGSSLEETIRKKILTLSGQVYMQPVESFQFALQGNYSPSNTRVSFPKSGLIDVEEGFSTFENYDIQAKAQYQLNHSVLLGFSGGYSNNNSWSKNSLKNLLLWEWDVKEIYSGIGVSYMFPNLPLLVGVEYEFANVKADSSKYIDSRSIDLTSKDHLIRFGMEYEIIDKAFVRGGFNFKMKEFDLITGGKDVNRLAINLGFEIPVFDMLSFIPYIVYQKDYLKDFSNVYRSNLSGFLTIKLNQF